MLQEIMPTSSSLIVSEILPTETVDVIKYVSCIIVVYIF